MNTSLTKIDLSCNSIGAEWAKYAAEALKVNTSLTVINLGLTTLVLKGTIHWKKRGNTTNGLTV